MASGEDKQFHKQVWPLLWPNGRIHLLCSRISDRGYSLHLHRLSIQVLELQFWPVLTSLTEVDSGPDREIIDGSCVHGIQSSVIVPSCTLVPHWSYLYVRVQVPGYRADWDCLSEREAYILTSRGRIWVFISHMFLYWASEQDCIVRLHVHGFLSTVPVMGVIFWFFLLHGDPCYGIF